MNLGFLLLIELSSIETVYNVMVKQGLYYLLIELSSIETASRQRLQKCGIIF